MMIPPGKTFIIKIYTPFIKDKRRFRKDLSKKKKDCKKRILEKNCNGKQSMI